MTSEPAVSDRRAAAGARCSPRGRGPRRVALIAGVLSSCALDFDLAGRQFECPPEVTGCLECNPDGSCRVEMGIVPVTPVPDPMQPAPPDPAPPPPDAGPATDGGVSPPISRPPDAGPPPPTGPTVPEECALFQSRTSDTLCLEGNRRCFSLGNVLSPALAAWLDPTTLPSDGSRRWCDRSGEGHHGLLVPDASEPRVEPDARGTSAALARSLMLDGGWLSLEEGADPVLRAGNFAVVIAAATPLDATDRAGLDLYESGADSTLSLSVLPASLAADGEVYGGEAVGRISSLETALVPDPVLTRSQIYDGGFHLFTLFRRSEVRVLDDVLQLRLNAVLEVRASSIAIPRALDLSASPRIGRSSAAEENTPSGRGRVAAIVILRGSVPEEELARLENFFCDELATCTAPGLPLGAPPAAPDAGP